MAAPEQPDEAAQMRERLAPLEESIRRRVRESRLSPQEMQQLLEAGDATTIDIPGAPVHYLDRWWRQVSSGNSGLEGMSWVALDQAGSDTVGRHAERWRAATHTPATPPKQPHTPIASPIQPAILPGREEP